MPIVLPVIQKDHTTACAGEFCPCPLLCLLLGGVGLPHGLGAVLSSCYCFMNTNGSHMLAICYSSLSLWDRSVIIFSFGHIFLIQLLLHNPLYLATSLDLWSSSLLSLAALNFEVFHDMQP